jgi:hypothetical protein
MLISANLGQGAYRVACSLLHPSVSIAQTAFDVHRLAEVYCARLEIIYGTGQDIDFDVLP